MAGWIAQGRAQACDREAHCGSAQGGSDTRGQRRPSDQERQGVAIRPGGARRCRDGAQRRNIRGGCVGDHSCGARGQCGFRPICRMRCRHRCARLATCEAHGRRSAGRPRRSAADDAIEPQGPEEANRTKPRSHPASLAAKLKSDRPADAPLLLYRDHHRRPFARAVHRAGVDPGVTIYALRHTSIVRQLLAAVPIRVVASGHDTSVVMIEKNYSKYIGDHADTIVRRAILDPSAPTGDNVVPLMVRS